MMKNRYFIYIAAFLFVFQLGLFHASSVYAQNEREQGLTGEEAIQRPSSLSGILQNGIVPDEELGDYMFSDYKRGCGNKFGFNYRILQAYRNGTDVNKMIPAKMLEAYIRKIYTNTQERGVEGTVISELKDYSQCVADSKPHVNPSTEYDLNMRHTACVKVADALVDILQSIKQRQSLETVVERYEDEEFDMEGSGYEGMEYLGVLLTGQLYKINDDKSYDDAVYEAARMQMRCFM